MIETTINDRWSLLLPEHRAARPEWATGWERERWDSIAANVDPGDVVLDIGTEEGDLSALLASWVGPTGKILLFEPNPKVWPNIRAIFEANGLADERVGLKWAGFVGPEYRAAVPDPDLEPVTYRDDGWPESAYGPLIGDHGFCVLNERPDLPAITIDGVVEQLGFRPTLITMDVEGAELEVLRGAVKTLTWIRPLVYVSVHHMFMWGSFQQLSWDLWRFMAQLGYQWERLAIDHEDHIVWHHPEGRELRR